MTLSIRLAGGATALILALAGCDRCGNSPGATPDSGAPSSSASVPSDAGAGPPSDAGDEAGEKQHGIRKFKGVDVPVYLDGAQIAVLRYGELPAIKPVADPEDDTKQPLYFRMYEYTRAVGIPPERVKSIHIRDAKNKVASIEGPELVARKTGLLFGFMSGATGVARTHWSTEGLKNERRIEEMTSVSYFVDKPAPRLVPGKWCHAKDDAPDVCTGDIPYVTAEAAKGTRVYVDGRMKGYVKRRALTDATVVGRTPEGEYRYNIAKFAGGVTADADRAAFVELVSGDWVVSRMDAETYRARQGDLVFTLPKHAHGKAMLALPRAIQGDPAKGKDEALTVTAVLFYKATAPTQRKVTPLADVDPSVLDAQSLDDGPED
jgi:hypothetical protein